MAVGLDGSWKDHGCACHPIPSLSSLQQQQAAAAAGARRGRNMSLIFRWHQSCGPPQTPAAASSSSARKKDARPRGRAARFRPFWLIRLPPFFFFWKMMAPVALPLSLSLSTSSSRKTDYETDGVAAFNLLFLFLLKVSFFFFQLGYIKRGESTLLA